MEMVVEHKPSYALGIVRMSAGESVRAETGAMVSMTSSVQVQSNMQGGFLKSAMRSVLGGESFFVNTFTAVGGPGEVTFAPTLPGDIQPLSLQGGDVFVQSGSYLAGESSVDVDLKWGGARTFFSSEGLFLLRLSGQGQVLVSSYGAVHRVALDGRGSYIVDTGHVVAFDSRLNWQVRKVSGLVTSLISGEGLVCEFSGEGELWLQTRSSQAFLSWLLPRLPTASASSGGRGGVAGGILGNILRGE
ncbi:MAG: TIGR00266 family protein [Acidobacteria bacterium]|nr:TIGR00266 family protein [Acidobacteriota bacterium]